MDFHEVVRRRRSVRKFRSDDVPTDVLNRILDAGRWAPSAANLQPWRFIVVTSADVKEKIADTCTRFSRKAWANFSPQTAKFLASQGGTWDKSHMKAIPVLVAVCYQVPEKLSNEIALGSAWAAVENMLLAATAENLGSCPYTLYDSEEEAELKKVLRVPQQHHIAAIIQLGYTSISPPTPPRKKLEEIVSHQHF